MPPPASIIPNEDETVSKMLSVIQDSEERYSTNGESILAKGALSHSRAHHHHIDEVVDDFIACLSEYSNQKWSSFLSNIPHNGLQGETAGPKILVELGGKMHSQKLSLANKALIDWQAVTKKKSKGNCGFQWYQPASQNQRLRSFFGVVKKRFNWEMTQNDFNFDGGVTAFLKTLYSSRLTEFGRVRNIHTFIFQKLYISNLKYSTNLILQQAGYGKRDSTKRIRQEDRSLLDISVFDENDPRQHQMKMLFGMGLVFGLRGSSEHTNLEIRNITHGEFPEGHPYVGYKYYGIDNLVDKTHKLTANVDYVRETENTM